MVHLVNGNITLEFAGTVWRSDSMTEEESVNIIADVRGKFFFSPISFKIEWIEADE